MKEAIEAAIKELSNKAKAADKALDAQQYAQAALSLSHCAATFKNME